MIEITPRGFTPGSDLAISPAWLDQLRTLDDMLTHHLQTNLDDLKGQ